ncbi:lactadherin-like [Amphiura filiformis]|uniref:lactadherin-like n=1 Tax=Amphiura filiformis TaxID=82378 RepID=UPI003B221F3E
MTTTEIRSLFLLIVALSAFLQVTAQATCQGRLGVEDGRITDGQLTASTVYDFDANFHGASNARLNRAAQPGTSGAWIAKVNDAFQWIQVDLEKPTWVTGVIIQGRQETAHAQWVTKFKVQYSNDGECWKFLQRTNNAGEKVFNGNTDIRWQRTGERRLFATPIKATYIRIRPTAWHVHISMRFELLGCEADDCQDPAGIEDGRIRDDQLMASSEFAAAIYHGVRNARLNRPVLGGTTGAWSAQTNDINQWVQVDLGGVTHVTGIMIQGRVDEDQWVTKFQVQSSKHGNCWKYVKTPNGQGDMEFNGSTDRNTVVVVLFPSPVRASFIRIRPTAWHNHISMRFEVLACDNSSIC